MKEITLTRLIKKTISLTIDQYNFFFFGSIGVIK